MLTDVGALLLSYAALALSERRPTYKHTFGFHRAEILAAFVNAELLLLLCGYVLYEAWSRFQDPPQIRIAVMMGVGAVGLVANLVSALLLHGSREENLNLKAAYLEVLTDTLGSIGVVAGGAAIHFTGARWIDPTVSVGIALFILPRAFAILRRSAHVLLEAAPDDVDVSEVRSRFLEIPGVEEVHDLHAWTLTSGFHSVSVHGRAGQDTPSGQVLRSVLRLLKRSPETDHATVQVERAARRSTANPSTSIGVTHRARQRRREAHDASRCPRHPGLLHALRHKKKKGASPFYAKDASS